jgi:homospermidine synthase
MSEGRFTQPLRGRLLVLGYGCIGQGVLPLLLRHLDSRAGQILVVSPDSRALRHAASQGVRCVAARLTPDDYRQELQRWLGPGDLLLNLSIDVGSVDLIAWCQQHGVLYLDTCIEPWAQSEAGSALAPAQRTNYARREAALALRHSGGGGPTALLNHGANPGLVTHLLKQALLDLAARAGLGAAPSTRLEWAGLAQALGVRVIHVAERDTQFGARRKQPGEFVNTWSVRAFVEEACQPAELGWGSHERSFPADGERHATGSRAAIFLRRPGASTRVRSWTPMTGPMQGFLITHAESIAIADLLTIGDPDRPDYRPTVHYAYQPCDDALLSLAELAAREWRMPERQHILKDDIVGGTDELGVLLMGHAGTSYWYGSQLSNAAARAACPANSATSLQVTAAVTAGVAWMLQHPDAGIVEPEDLPHDAILAMCRPYLGEVVGVFSDWTPLRGRDHLFVEDLDRSDPWQFRNFRVG